MCVNEVHPRLLVGPRCDYCGVDSVEDCTAVMQ